MSGKRRPGFDVDTLRTLAGAKVFARGEAYHREGRVTILGLEPRRVVARVAGSEDYRSVLTGKGKDIDGECTCPAIEDWGFCKHLVAVGLAANAAIDGGAATGDDALTRIRGYLRAKGIDAAVEMLIGQAERDPALFRDLDMAAAAATEDDAALQARFRVAIDEATRAGGFVGYREVPTWAAEVEAVLGRIAGLIADGRAAPALSLIDHAMTRIGLAIESIDDSDGRGGALLHQARDIHLDACRAVRPDPAVLARDLFAREVKGEWDTFDGASVLYADILGEAGLAEYRRLTVIAWRKLPPLVGRPRTETHSSVERARLGAILDAFAEREGDVEARIAIRARDLSTAWRYLELAKFCLAHEREVEALRWAEEGVWLFDDGAADEGLLAFTAELLARAGRLGDAEALLWRGFEQRPSLALYQRLRRIGGEAARDRAIGDLRRRLAKSAPPSRWDSPADLLIRVLMEESMFESAWQAVRAHGASAGLKESLAKASEVSHPGESLAVYVARVDALVAAGGNGNYAEARRLVARMARLRDASAQETYVTALKSRFRAKRNFMKLLAA